MLWKAWHYAHAIEGRLFQHLEWSHLHKAGVPVSDRLRKEIFRNPGSSEDWINLARFLSPADPVYLIDVGANVGDFTARALEEYSDLRSVCFEPVQSNFDTLQKRFAGNPNVAVHRVAASNENTAATMYIGRSNTLCSLEKYTREGDHAYGIGDNSYDITETIQCRRLDSEIFDPGGRKVLLKVDVQGHEEKAIEGAAAIFPLVDVAIIECSFANEYEGVPPSFSGVAKHLAAADLFPVVFQNYGELSSAYAFERDVIFVRNHLLKNIWYDNYGIPSL